MRTEDNSLFAAIRGSLRAANKAAANEFVHELTCCRAGEPDVIGNCGDRAGHLDKLEYGQLWGVELCQMQQGQSATGIVAMHFAQESADEANEFPPAPDGSVNLTRCGW
ncbi:MAG: hypothetical protein WBC92_03390 [Terracidiphilus sp.]